MKKNIWQQAERMARWVGGLCLGGLLITGCATTNEDTKFSPLPSELATPTEETARPPSAGLANPANDGPTNSENSALSGLLKSGGVLAVGDLVTIKFSGTVDQIPPHEERIKDDGTITLSLIGAVKAVGKTTGDLQVEIHSRYVPDYYKRLTITVTGEQRVYYVGGQVRAPGPKVYLGITTVTKAVQSAGDFTDFAAKRRVELTRADGKQLTINCEKATEDSSMDLQIFPGDKIHVPLRGWRDIFWW